MSVYLDEALTAYANSDCYPFHMPGHKRRPFGLCGEGPGPEQLDITEIDGFDNLHSPEGILKEVQQRLAALFGATQSFLLVNGSTAGILAAVCGCLKKGDALLIGRNCHKAVFHAAYLMEAPLFFVYPEETDFGIQGSISPRAVEAALSAHPQVKAVLITSPTYDGIVSDVAGIADVAHRFGVPLIVDAAHGAHFGFSPDFPQKAIALGADVSVESLHKTLPSLTQTAVLHVQGESPFLERIKRYLHIFQSSSPSYVLMAGVDACLRLLQEEQELSEAGEDNRFLRFGRRLAAFYEACSKLQRIRVFCAEDPFLQKKTAGIFGRDASKILISARNLGLTGRQLYDILKDRDHLQPEMAAGHYVTLLCSIMDTDEGFARLLSALQALEEEEEEESEAPALKQMPRLSAKKRMELFEALDAPRRWQPLEEAVGCVAVSFVSLYPPGIPVLVPGEEITTEAAALLLKSLAQGLTVEGLADGAICVWDENVV